MSASNLQIHKNDTRIASLLGTWTGLTNIKTDVGKYSLQADYILHIVGDSMRVNSCSISGCNEMDNMICEKPRLGTEDSSNNCHDMTEVVSDWSDVSVFLFASVKVQSKNGINTEQTTGDWIGPYSIVTAQNKSAITTARDPAPGDIVDQYTAKYLETPSTPYLSMGDNCTFFGEKDFENILGKNCLDNTVMRQSQLSNSTYSFTGASDPFIDYYKTCDNGDLKPMLPLIDFIFLADENGGEKLHVKLHHKLTVTPKKGSVAYHSMPLLTKLLPISGPYCYDNDPNRAYTFDIAFDSSVENKLLTLKHACVEGLPCAPPALVKFAQPHDQIKPDDMPAPVMIEVGTLVSLSIALAVVLFLFLVSIYFNFHKKNVFSRLKKDHEEPPSIPSHVAFEQVEMKNTEIEGENEDDLRASLLQNNLNVGATKNGIMFV